MRAGAALACAAWAQGTAAGNFWKGFAMLWPVPALKSLQTVLCVLITKAHGHRKVALAFAVFYAGWLEDRLLQLVNQRHCDTGGLLNMAAFPMRLSRPALASGSNLHSGCGHRVAACRKAMAER